MTLERVEITRGVVGPCWMQVCVVTDATDEEILAVCNRQNPSGTTGGWQKVNRMEWADYEDKSLSVAGPVPCKSYPKDRLHILVGC